MKVAILGYGMEGRSVYEYFKKNSPAVGIMIFDQNDRRSELKDAGFTQVGDFSEIDFSSYDKIYRTPSIPPTKINAPAEKISSATALFFEKCPALIIGVTGTKGKGTVCTMITEILKAAGKNTYLVGNIGIPSLNILDEVKSSDIVIYELSSFQLWDLHVSPPISVIVRIAPDHLNVHAGMDDYVAAKSNIAKYQHKDDLVIYFIDNKISKSIAELSAGKKLSYPSEIGAHILDNNFLFSDQLICSTDVIDLPGDHYKENALAAISAVYPHVISDKKAIETGLKNFKGMPHRLEFVREFHGVQYYDDSFSASSPSLEVALKAFPNNHTILIAGGFDRGLDQTPITDAISSAKNLKKVFLIGQTKHRIAEKLDQNIYEFAETLKEAVEKAHGLSREGDIVLLSPGTPSFDMFKNFSDRGNQFQTLVKELK